MLIHELAKQSGLSKDTLRFYEKLGLLESHQLQRKSNNYREYSQAALQRLLVIGDLKEFGFTLTEIGDIVRLYETDPDSCPQNIPKIQAKLQTLDEKIARLTLFRNRLQATLVDCSTDCEAHCTMNQALNGLPVFVPCP